MQSCEQIMSENDSSINSESIVVVIVVNKKIKINEIAL